LKYNKKKPSRFFIISLQKKNKKYIYCSSNNYELLFCYKMEPDAGEEPSPVRAIHFLPELRRSCVAMHNGRMFLCDCDVIPASQAPML
jgi:hypothetical protein